MKVRLISHTMPSEEMQSEGFSDLKNIVSYCARVSNPKNQLNFETEMKLLEYLMREAHWSPFEIVNVCMEIETTRDIARQLLRHRSFAFQEFSQRYADPTEFDFAIREARLQDNKNRQNSIEIDDPELQAAWENHQQDVINAALSAYSWAIDNGIAKEQARAVLPEGNTSSRLYMNGSIRSWIHFLLVRRHESTQKEHREIANACAKELEKVFPISYLDNK